MFTKELGATPRSQMIVTVCLAPWFIDPFGQSSQGPQQSWAQSLGRHLWTWPSLHRYPPIPPSLLPGSLGPGPFLRLPVLYLENYSALTSPVETMLESSLTCQGLRPRPLLQYPYIKLNKTQHIQLSLWQMHYVCLILSFATGESWNYSFCTNEF